MSIRLTANASIATPGAAFLAGQAQAGISFFLRYDGNPASAVGNFNFVWGAYTYFQFYSEYVGGNVRVTTILTLDDGVNPRQYPSATIVLNPNTVYHVLVTTAPTRQKLYGNGVATTMGSYNMPVVGGFTGATNVGDPSAASGFGFSVRDLALWAGYEPTASDAAALRDGADPSTIGGGASARYHWTLAGTQGQAPQVGDAGLVETFGTGLPFNSLTPGSGTILYSDAMPFVPAATVSARVSSGGRAIYVSCADLAGHWTPETAYFAEPTITCPALNGGAPFSLADSSVRIFRDSECRGMLYRLPPGWILGPSDVVTMSLPVGAYNTAAGITAGLSNVVIPNHVGRSAYGNNPEELPRTLKFGIVVDPAAYQVYGSLPIEANYVPRADGPSGISGPGGWNLGGITSLASNPGRFAVAWPTDNHTWIDQNPQQNYPLGEWAVRWDDTGADPVNHPTYFKLTNGTDPAVEVTGKRNSGTAGQDQARIYNIQMPSNGTYLQIYVEVYNDQLTPRFANLAVYQPGDMNGGQDYTPGQPAVIPKPVVGAQGHLMQTRLPACGAVRWVDNNQSTFGMIGPEQFTPFPAFAYWGGGGYSGSVGVTTIRQFVPGRSPYTYNHLFGESYSCTLGPSQSLDAPAAGTRQTITISDASATPVLGGTGPIFPGQTLTNGAEKIRVISVDPTTGTLTTVIRGSGGTTPQAAAAGATLGVDYRKTMGSTLANYVGGSGFGLEFVEYVTGGRHPFWIGLTPAYSGGWVGSLTFPSGMVLAAGDYIGTAILIPTGPNTFLQFWGYGSGTTPNETLAADIPLTGAMLSLTMPTGEGASAPYQAQCAATEAMGGDHWVAGLPMGTDDAHIAMAEIYLAQTRPGSIKFIELGNEPWNYIYATTALYGFLDFVTGDHRFDLWGSLVRQTAHVRALWRRVFRPAGREDEIRAVLNLHTGNIDPSTWGLPQAMNLVRDVINPADADAAIDLFVVAPYWGNCYLASFQEALLATDVEAAMDLTLYQMNCRSTPMAYSAPISGYADLSVQTIFNGDYTGSSGLANQAASWTSSNAAWCAAHLPAGRVGVGIYEYGLAVLTVPNLFRDSIQNTDPISGGLDVGTTALVVANAAQFAVGMYLLLDPATASDGSGDFAGAFWGPRSEWALVTGINTSTNTLTIVRGQGNSTAKAHAHGVGVGTAWLELSRDLAYHPLGRILEMDYLAQAQRAGCSVACYHSLDFAYFSRYEQWGIFHGAQQLPGLGDGSDGKANNLLCQASPGPGQKAQGVNQDAHNVSVRGQALRDWNLAVGAPAFGPPSTMARAPWRARWRARVGAGR